MSVKKVTIKPEFIDPRGFISRVLDDKKVVIRSILHIERKKGETGANHYHKKDSHYIYIIKGKMKYFEKDMTKKNSKVISVILKAGDLMLSPKGIWHRTDFLEDTMFMAFATEHRSQKEYEKDTVRINFIAEKKSK